MNDQTTSPLAAEILVATEEEIVAALMKRFAIRTRPLKSGDQKVAFVMKRQRRQRPKRRGPKVEGVNPKWKLEEAMRERDP